MKLVIAEKPSVAQSLAAVIGATARKDGYLEGGGWRVSWCVGHLAGLADADAYNPDYAKWRYDDLPILPEHWQMVVSKDKKKQFEVLKQLMNAPDVTEVVNACDAGREGELIFRSVYELAGCQKPMKRLWISSMEDSAIREGFANLRPGADYDGLRDAALCRAKADWLVGINATRLFSVLYHRTLNIGRVMSPTLALIVQREAEIDTFKPVPFYTVTLELPGFSVSGERMADKAAAQQMKTACQGAAATVKKVEHKDKSEKPPALYDLTTLQRDANRLLGYTAQQTLDYLQNLYEKKLCTYPRTDSRYLTSDMAASLPELQKGFFCQNEGCKFAIWKNNKWWELKRKQPTKAVVTALLKDGRAHVTGLYSEKTGKTYDATVVLEDDGKYANFKLAFDRQKGGKR